MTLIGLNMMLFIFLLFMLIMAVIARWVFRINDIVKRLDNILYVLRVLQKTQEIQKKEP